MYEKVIQSGSLIEIYSYEKDPAPRKIKVGYTRPVDPAKRVRASRNVNRSKVQFWRLVRATLALGKPTFVTLTMADVVSLDRAYKDFSMFSTRMRKKFGSSIAWVAVPEFQERGAVHFHALFWGLPKEAVYQEAPFESYLGARRGNALVQFILFCQEYGYDPHLATGSRDIQTLWRRGWCDLSPTDGSPRIGSYLSKYMSKSMSDPRSAGRKCFLASRNAVRPMRTTLRTQIAFIKRQILKPHRRKSKRVGVDKYTLVKEKEYDTLWLGRANYKQYLKEVVI